MELKNYQEDVVLGLIDILLEDEPEFVEDTHFKYDVAAFTLNRIRPKYFMSERGFTRFANLYLANEDDSDSFANLVELGVIIQSGIDTIKLRRSALEHEPNGTESREPTHEYIHNFPHIIGRALDSRHRSPIAGADVALVLDGAPVPPADSGWPNPYKTTGEGKGYFSFWPKYQSDSRESLNHELVVTIEHGSFRSLELPCPVETTGEFEMLSIIRSESIVSLEACLLEPK